MCIRDRSNSVSYEKMVTTKETNSPINTVEISNDPLINNQINNKKINNLNCENKRFIIKHFHQYYSISFFSIEAINFLSI